MKVIGAAENVNCTTNDSRHTFGWRIGKVGWKHKLDLIRAAIERRRIYRATQGATLSLGEQKGLARWRGCTGLTAGHAHQGREFQR